MPSSISCSQHTPLPANKCCRRQLLPSNIVSGQKNNNWKSSKHPEALQEGAKCMAMRLCNEWKWPGTERSFSQYLHTVTKQWYKIIVSPNDLKAYFHPPGLSPYVRPQGKYQCRHHSLAFELSYLSLFSIPMCLFLSLHCHPFSSGLLWTTWKVCPLETIFKNTLRNVFWFMYHGYLWSTHLQTNTYACSTLVSPHVFTV